MRTVVLSLLTLLLSYPCLADQVIEHGGHKIVSFDLPQLEYRATKTGKTTRTYFSNPVGNGNLKLTVTTKGWLSEEEAIKRYEDDKKRKRANPETRLHDSKEIPGAMKTLFYSMSSPYRGKVIVVYTKDFRCELLITGTNDAEDQINPTYEQLAESLKVIPRTKIGDLKIGD